MKIRVLAVMAFLMLVLAVPASAEWKLSVHYLGVGFSRSYTVSAPDQERNYATGVGGGYFLGSADNGRIKLFGTMVSPAYNWRRDELSVATTFVPIAFRIQDRFYVGPTLGKAEIGSRSAPKTGLFGGRFHRTVGVQLSMCLLGCS